MFQLNLQAHLTALSLTFVPPTYGQKAQDSNHVAEHALITKLIILQSRECACTVHALITWLIMH